MITLNNPEKGGNPRIFRIDDKLAIMLGALPKRYVKVFGNITLRGKTSVFRAVRAHTAKKLGNPRLLRIRFHTLRHWKATVEYHKTKDILHVKELLGHRKIDTTTLYIQLDKALFQGNLDEFTVRVAAEPEEIRSLLEVGFEYVCQKDGLAFFRKRK